VGNILCEAVTPILPQQRNGKMKFSNIAVLITLFLLVVVVNLW